MKKLVNFFRQIGKLKEMPRTGWVIRGIKNSESIADHIFRTSLMAWILGNDKKGLNMERVLKMALIHDLCEVYAGDITPYDSILPKSKKEREKILKTWPRFSLEKRKKLSDQKFKKEKKGLEKLIKNLPPKLADEVMALWMDYENGSTAEGRFFKQADRLENLLQATEYWEKNKNLSQTSWWDQARELFDDPILLQFIEDMDQEFHGKTKPKN